MTQDWLPRVKHDAQWSDAQSIMVHVNDRTGKIRYVGSHEARLKDGYHREYLRSLPEINRFEREHKVVNHVMHYDRNGRAIDDTYRGRPYNH